MDLTADTVTASKLLAGITAHDKAGNPITGTYSEPSGSINITKNGTYDVSSFEVAAVSVPSGFENHVSGSFTGAEQTRITLDTGSFQPKVVIIMLNDAAFNNSTSTYYYGSLFCFWDNSGTAVFQRADFLSKWSDGRARLGRTSSGFSRSGSTVSFYNNDTFKFKSGTPYQYHIWG